MDGNRIVPGKDLIVSCTVASFKAGDFVQDSPDVVSPRR